MCMTDQEHVAKSHSILVVGDDPHTRLRPLGEAKEYDFVLAADIQAQTALYGLNALSRLEPPKRHES